MGPCRPRIGGSWGLPSSRHVRLPSGWAFAKARSRKNHHCATPVPERMACCSAGAGKRQFFARLWPPGSNLAGSRTIHHPQNGSAPGEPKTFVLRLQGNGSQNDGALPCCCQAEARSRGCNASTRRSPSISCGRPDGWGVTLLLAMEFEHVGVEPTLQRSAMHPTCHSSEPGRDQVLR